MQGQLLLRQGLRSTVSPCHHSRHNSLSLLPSSSTTIKPHVVSSTNTSRIPGARHQHSNSCSLLLLPRPTTPFGPRSTVPSSIPLSVAASRRRAWARQTLQFTGASPRFLSSSRAAFDSTPLRKNRVDVQMLHPDLHRHVFPSTPKTPPSSTVQAQSSLTSPSPAGQDSLQPTDEMVRQAINHLEKQNLWGKPAILVPDTTFPLPPLRGRNIEDHFYNIGVHASAGYKEIATQFSKSEIQAQPTLWALQEGWTRYNKDGSIERVPYPRESALTFDVETVPALSKFPVMACAVSAEAWYGWVSPWLIQPKTILGAPNDHHLVPFGPSTAAMAGQEKILVGHNVGYDRARVLEEYCLESNGMRYLDTMSLHIASSGLCTQQRPSWLKYSKAVETEDVAYVDANKDTTGKYFDVSSVNSLAQVAKFHCGINMDKAPRNILMEAQTIDPIQESFQELMQYCASDVSATHAVYRTVFPKFIETCPHPVSFAGILQMGSSFLTVNEGWVAYIKRCNALYNEISTDVEAKLTLIAENALANFERGEKLHEQDPWLSQLDWTLPKRVWKEGIPLVSGKGYRKGQEPRWMCGTKILPDKPQWYRNLWDSSEGRVKISTKQRIAPILLKLQWHGYPLYHSQLHGWTFRVPREVVEFETKTKPLEFPAEGEKGYQASIEPEAFHYYRLPHASGEGANVGNPLAKYYIQYFGDNTLSTFAADGDLTDESGKLARQALDMNAQCAYWVSARERIEDQMVVWDRGMKGDGQDALGLDRMGIPDRGPGQTNGMILPQIITMGTVTRRAVEKTWMTASNAKKNRIGSELKSMVEAPTGYKIVGADVDSEELWISSLMGDAQFRMHGATALGWMTLQGTKAAGTDLHSKTAQILGISRDQAKIFNYGRIYGAGLAFAATLLQQFNTTIDATEAKKRARNLYTATKGAKEHKAPDYEVVHDRSFWHGGTESFMFNSLERTATAEDPRTPALGCGITDALKPKYTEQQFMTSRVNWVVQSSGVDYLHLLLVSMNYLIRKYGISARFMLCVHDEVRYLVKEEDYARATLALQISNLWTRALFSYKLGIHDLPQSVAFFSCVDIDHVFRKEVNMDCTTPTQKSAIAHGHSLTIEQVLEVTDGGQLGPVATGFVEAKAEDFPISLKTLEERRKLTAMATMANLRNESRAPEAESDAISKFKALESGVNEPSEVFLEAQALGTMREIKQMIKRREAEHIARIEAAERGSRGDGNGQGERNSKLAMSKKPTVKRTARLVKNLVSASPLVRFRKTPTGNAAWGQASATVISPPEVAALSPAVEEPMSIELQPFGTVEVLTGLEKEKALSEAKVNEVETSLNEVETSLNPDSAQDGFTSWSLLLESIIDGTSPQQEDNDDEEEDFKRMLAREVAEILITAESAQDERLVTEISPYHFHPSSYPSLSTLDHVQTTLPPPAPPSLTGPPKPQSSSPPSSSSSSSTSPSSSGHIKHSPYTSRSLSWSKSTSVRPSSSNQSGGRSETVVISAKDADDFWSSF